MQTAKNQYFNSLKRKSSLRYFLVGGLAFLVDYLTLLVLYYSLNVPLNIATSLGFFSGMCVSFMANRHWVFGDSGKYRGARRQSLEYVALVIFNYFFTVLGVNLLDKIEIEPWLGKLLIIGLIAVWNYFIYKKIIFTDKKANRVSGK